MTNPGRLEGFRVLITRPRERATELCFLLEDEGAEVSSVPLLELRPPEDLRPLRSAAEQLHRYAWVAFSSPSAVDALVEAAREAGTLDRLGAAKLAVVGPATARAVVEHGWTPACEASEASGSGLFAALQPRLVGGDEVLLPVAEEGRRELHEALLEHGVAVTRVVAYRAAPATLPGGVLEELAQRPPHAGLFSSPRSVEALLEAMGEEGRRLLHSLRVVAIGPTTGAALTRLGVTPAAVSTEPTAAGLVDATVRALRG